MGCTVSHEEAAMRKRDRQLKKMMKTRQKNTRKVYKIMLLGSGESGKSTVMKQLRINYENGLKSDFVTTFVDPIRENLVQGQNEIWQAIAYIQQENQADEAVIEDVMKNSTFLVNEVQGTSKFDVYRSQIKEMAAELISQDDYKEVVENTSRYNVSDHSPYFVNNYERVCDEHYIPITQDVLNCRIRTTGFNRTTLSSGPFDIELIDVGGQRCERSKWLHLFDKVDFVMFVVAISDYDLRMKEDQNEWRIVDSLKLFQHMSSNALLSHPTFILFLNKTDLFEIKIPKIPLSRCFNDYTGGPSFDKAKTFMEEKFKERFQPIEENKALYVYFTSANDTQSMQAIVTTIHQKAFTSAFQELGFT